jgi:hypothetical protein
MRQLVIDRSKWRTGGNILDTQFGVTQLLNDNGMMCCLGFYCLQIGNKTENEISEIGLPESLDSCEGIEELIEPVSDIRDFKNNDFTEIAIYINDSEELSNEFREIQIHQHFKKINVDVKFVNEYPS